MEKWEGKVAVVTGASAGIGAAISKTLVRKGLLVVGIARRIHKIEDNAKSLEDEPGKLYAVRCDVAREENILRAFEWIKTNLGVVHVLVNNAGLTRPTTLIDGATEEWRRVLDVNVMALSICTREAIRSMQENDVAGQIIHINSVLGHVVPNLPLNMYGASKFAVTALAETLRFELMRMSSPIKISCISPGLVKTEFQNGISGPASEALEEAPALMADDVVEAVIYVLSTPPHVQVQDVIIKPLGEVV